MKEARGKIIGIKFGLLSPEMIKKMAAMKITRSELYDPDGYPIEGGLMDPRMGIIDPGLRCRTCGGRFGECNGHFGYIELARPVVNPLFGEMIRDLLNAFCPKCGRLTLSEKEKEQVKELVERYKRMYKDVELNKLYKEILKKAAKVKKCPHCSAEKKTVRFKKPFFYYEEDRRMNPVEIRERLEIIRDEDLPLVGIDPSSARPEWMVLTMLPVPPVTARASIILESGERSEDDLTHILAMITRTNNKLLENINAGSPEHIIDNLWLNLQYYVAAYINNELPNMPPARSRAGRPLKTLISRIKGKEGRLRHNLEGKRVNFSARAVISPDNYIDIDEVGVPYEVAMELTVPEKVNEINIEKLRRLVLNGPKNYPGANYVITPDGKRIRITEQNKEQLAMELRPGYIVERHLLDGDIALFNRQPSLHRMSIMGHRVKVLPGKTFRIHLATTVPYNADFDGDEMNLHVPQTEEAQAEARLIMEVKNHIITPRYGLPIIGPKHGHITGLYILTKLMDRISKYEVSKLLIQAKISDTLPEPAGYENGEPYWTGKQIFSMLLPKDLNYEGETADGHRVVIKNGELIEGWIDRSSVGAEKGKLLALIVEKYGLEFAKEFIWKISMLGIKALEVFGSTVSLSHYDLPSDVRERIKMIVREAEEQAWKYIEEYKKGKLIPLPGMTPRDTLEQFVRKVLDDARMKVEDIIRETMENVENFTLAMARSKARGDMLNFVMTAALIGQMTVRGKRPREGYPGRTLPHFKIGDLGPRAKGFVKSSYSEGMDPIEFFFAHMSGRDSLIDTHVRTPVSGYMYRRLSFALQDLFVRYDGTVRDGWGVIIQFKYGEDGVDPQKTLGGTFDVRSIVEKVLGNEAGGSKKRTSRKRVRRAK